jgi:hypothetical protein
LAHKIDPYNQLARWDFLSKQELIRMLHTMI